MDDFDGLCRCLFASGACMADEAVLSNADGLALMKKNNCTACHSVEKKIVGPAFKDVAAKYRGQADAEAKLAGQGIQGWRRLLGQHADAPATSEG